MQIKHWSSSKDQWQSDSSLREALAAIRVSADVNHADAPGLTITELAWWARKVPISRGRNRPGHVATWDRQPLIPCESEVERRVIRWLAAQQQCIALATQPVSISYRYEGRARRYTPDVLCLITDEQADTAQALLLEIKPQEKALKWADTAMRRCSAAVAMGLKVPLLLVATDDLILCRGCHD